MEQAPVVWTFPEEVAAHSNAKSKSESTQEPDSLSRAGRLLQDPQASRPSFQEGRRRARWRTRSIDADLMGMCADILQSYLGFGSRTRCACRHPASLSVSL